MKNKLTLGTTIFFTLTFGIIALFSCNPDSKKTDEKEDTSYGSTITESSTPCNCGSDWFPHSQTPPPAEGKGSPFDTISTTNCIFQQWAWQKFLWLTKPEGDLPLFLNQDSILQVTDAMAVVPQQAGANVVLTDTEQAGHENALLNTNAAYNSASGKSYTVYYSIHTSPTMFDAANTFRTQLSSGTLPANNLAAFPVGSLELKISWVDANAIPSNEIGNYFTTIGAVDKVNTKMALLGMHVVGVVENHPEFIWATFEHKDIAPFYDWPSNAASATSEELLFSAGSTSGISGITYDAATQTGKTPYKVFDLFQYGVPRNAAGYLTTSQEEPLNYNNIDELNECVAAQLSDVWNNYFYDGAIWINTDGLTPAQQAMAIVNAGSNLDSALPDSIARGSLNNANVSMETFTQTFQSSIDQISVSNLVNCFTCHNGRSFSGDTSPIYISHIFDASIQSGLGKTRAQINNLKDNQQRIQAGRKLK